MTTTNLPQITVPGDVRPGRNFTGSDIAKYLLVKAVAATAPDSIAVTAADTDVPIGVTMEAIGDQKRGDLILRGRHPVTASGAITAGARLAPDAAGKVKAAAAGDSVIGVAVDAATNDGDVIMAELNVIASGFW